VTSELAASGAAGDSVGQLGARLRTARQKSGMTLRALARELGVSASFVSQLENGKSQPSVATLYSIAQLLDVSIDELFAPAADEGPTAPKPRSAPDESGGAAGSTSSGARATKRAEEPTATPTRRAAMGSPADAWPDQQNTARLSVTVPGNRARLVMDTGVIWEQLATNTAHNLEFMEVIYPAGSSSTNDDRMLRHEGFEYGYLIEGELQVTFGFEVFMVRAGEAFGFDSAVPHLFKNLGSVQARGIWFVHHPH